MGEVGWGSRGGRGGVCDDIIRVGNLLDNMEEGLLIISIRRWAMGKL